MKRQFKIKKNKGFTLLETILSVAIMVIISTMLLNGFAATMGYSYHTSVYTKSAAANYSASMNTLSALHNANAPYEADGKTMKQNNYYYAGSVALDKDVYSPDGSTYANYTSGVTISFESKSGVTTNAAGSSVLNDLNAVEFAYKEVPSDLEVGGIIENASVAANRRTFFYYPTYNYDPTKIDSASDPMNDAYLGHVNIYLINKGTNAGKYCWGYLTDNTDATTFVAVGTPFAMG